ncbi:MULTISPECIES: beta-galactosidase [Paenibacillus]|uniref:beta-galactosidase n=1 Tax=Paenibacillus TaxID=44249 RepID=UPI00040E0212|nr:MULTISPECIES: beta-galactosidase [Paenibacillus]KGP79454.1 beta-galactosidase [Paenibacillus sp. MAEPY2]KGP87939.1 beta-galactosidase [Paenibacillus sp. MAEPY1]OZQ64805.1 beta-galactosidase [Paenibacillus taichungensis]HBU81031.1 beta-galactosidase [Paenibacillus sp.]
MDKLLYGVAYYDEYMPYERLDKDIQMMKDAGINVVRIAESTWSTHEPQSGVFDFSSVDRVLDAMHAAGIQVIVGTPTYAVPTWMVKEHPEVLATTVQGPGKYGARQIMDITHPTYLFYAERIIRKLISRVSKHPAVIGYQTDNETKHYNTAGDNVQLQFVKYMRNKFSSLDDLNKEFGLDYWSNRINSWEDFPSVVGTINGSLGAEFAKFQRQLVTDFLAWQVGIVNEYKQEGQFVTQNFDFDWRGYSYGIQGDVDHFAASKPFDITSVDIYHPSQDELTGIEISFGGDVARSTKQSNYLVLETEAQAFWHWVPYPGQLRLQAFSHLASGANMVAYWHWHSLHNSFETYWKGLLSHDFEPNPVYNEAKTIGRDFARLSPQLVNLKKTNRVAVLFSNEALTSIKWFGFNFTSDKKYNDVVRWMYDELYKMNIGCDLIDPSVESYEGYDVIVVPALYAASDALLERLNQFVQDGGHVVYSFKSGFANEHIKVRSTRQPGLISEACGITYNLFVEPKNVSLRDDPFEVGEEQNQIHTWMELITPTTAEVLAWYEHPHWGEYAAITQNAYGKGKATYVGCYTSSAVIRKVLERVMKEAGLWVTDQELAFPIIVKSGVNEQGNTIRYFFNYSDQATSFVNAYGDGTELLAGTAVSGGHNIELEPWGFCIIEQ